MELSGEATEGFVADGVQPAHPYFELQVVAQGQGEFRLPFFHDRIDLDQAATEAFHEGTQWSVVLNGESVELVHPDKDAGIPFGTGDSVELDGARITLLDVRRPPLATLHGISPSVAGRVWQLAEQQSLVGRSGKRINHVELLDSTISRTHATFLPGPFGRVALLAEASGTPTVVNGVEVAVGKNIELSHGDIIGFGKLQFRFWLPIDATSAEAALCLKTLGSFHIELGAEAILWDVSNPKTKWLVGALGIHWDKPCSVEWLLGTFWPDLDSARARKALGYTLGQIKTALGLDDKNFESLILRTTTTLQFNPKRLGSHDHAEVSRLTRKSVPLTSAIALERLVSLYQGGFLSDCYEDWAAEERRSVEADVVKTLLLSAEFFAERHDLVTVKVATEKIQAIDPLSEEAVKVLMEAALEVGRPDIALEAYKKYESLLKKEGMEPHSDLLRLSYRANLGI